MVQWVSYEVYLWHNDPNQTYTIGNTVWHVLLRLYFIPKHYQMLLDFLLKSIFSYFSSTLHFIYETFIFKSLIFYKKFDLCKIFYPVRKFKLILVFRQYSSFCLPLNEELVKPICAPICFPVNLSLDLIRTRRNARGWVLLIWFALNCSANLNDFVFRLMQ